MAWLNETGVLQQGRKPGSRNRRSYRQPRVCETCESPFSVEPNQLARGEGRFCSRACKHEAARRAPKKPLVDGPIRHSAGYLLDYAPDHPRAIRGRVFQHILVLEKKLGRMLASDEESHHVNAIRDDNRSENLEVVKKGEHQRMHNLARYAKKED